MPYIGNPIYQSAFVTDQFSGTGSATAFTMSVAPAGVSNVLVAVSGVLQDPSTYGVVGTTITFSTAPPSGTGNISCRYLGVPASGVTTTAYRTVTEFTATASQTTFTPPSYTVGFISVFLNGVLLGSTDYTATNGTTVVLTTGASSGNLVTVESFLVSSVLNAIPNTAGAVSSSNIQTSPTLTTPTIDKINTSVSGVSLGAGNASIMKNRLINSDMRIDQRNAGASVTQNTSTQYVTDRFGIYGSVTSKFTGQQSSTAPTGFNNSLLLTSSSAYTVGAAETFFLTQRIEGFNTADLGFGTANAKTVTLSFWVRSSLTGTFGGSLMNNAYDRSYPFSYTISVANTWEQKSITIAGDTTGTWVGATNGVGLRVHWSLGTGSTYSGTSGAWAGAEYYSSTGATNVVGTSGATFYITGVQLEVGSSATGFEYRQYTTELQLCERYYQLISAMNGTSGGSGGTLVYCQVPVRTSMRTTPSAGQTGVFAFELPFGSASTQSSVGNSLISAASNNNGIYIYFSNFSGLSANVPLNKYSNANQLILSAEL